MRVIYSILLFLFFLTCVQNVNSQTIRIDSCTCMDVPENPQIFSVKGTAELPKKRYNEGVNTVIIYTKDRLGGKIQLQNDNGNPKSVELDIFICKETETGSVYCEWDVPGIWLGTPGVNSKHYEVYAIIVKTKTSAGVKGLMTTNNLFQKKPLLQELQKRDLEPVVTYKPCTRDK